MQEVNVSKNQGEMDTQFTKEYFKIRTQEDLENFAEDWGYTADELVDYISENPHLIAEEPKEDERGLTGNRDADGTLKVDVGYPKYGEVENDTLDIEKQIAEPKEFKEKPAEKSKEVQFTHADGSYATAEPGTDLANALRDQQYFPGDIAAQNTDKEFTPETKGMLKVDLNKIAREDDEVGVEEPEGEDKPDNKFGYHKKPGQSFWTVNNSDPYWDTHEMGTGDAWSDAELKKETKDLDIDLFSWFK